MPNDGKHVLIPADIFSNFNFVAIDPGLITCGISIFKIRNKKLNSVEAFTIFSDKVSFISEYKIENHSDRIIRMDKLCLAFNNILETELPILVCCEAPFYNPRMPSAYGSLMETVTALRLTTHKFNSLIPFKTYAPQEVKQSFKRSGQIGKLVMKEALANIIDLVSVLVSPVETLDEHAVDAIAVGYTWYKTELERSLND